LPLEGSRQAWPSEIISLPSVVSKKVWPAAAEYKPNVPIGRALVGPLADIQVQPFACSS
jgi:hypothetical protein